MGKPRLPNQKKAYKELSKRLAGYMMRVRNIYDGLNEKAAMLVESVGYEGLAEFSFNDYPEIEREVKLLLSQFVGELQTLIYSGTSSEWKSSNTFQDAVANKALKYYRAQVHGDKFKHYYRDNGDQLKAFLQRQENGLNLSSKLWNQSKNYKEALEATISTAIEKGMSAVTLSKRLSKYLNDWPSLQADYQERYGKATNIYDCEYRSLRLARNEISMAYRSAEQARWQQFDFILGYKIKLSDSHPRYDICDDLAGDYPKDFKFRGWHPNCYSDDTQVLTNHGWRLFKDVRWEDVIFSLNPSTHNVEWVGIDDMQEYESNGKMYHFFNKSLDCLVTPEHRMVYLNKSDGRIKYCLAKDYTKGKGAFYRGCEYIADDIDTIEISEKKYPFDLFCEFMGYYLSDGSLQHKTGIIISQKDGQPYKYMIVDCIKNMGFAPRIKEDTIEFYNVPLNRYLTQFGIARKKFIPTIIKNASKKQIQIFLDAFIKCDGYTRKTRKSFVGSHGNIFVPKLEEKMYFTTSPQMASDLSELILKVGKRPSFRVQKPTDARKKDGTIIHGNFECWIISECKSLTSTVFEKKEVSYKGKVYDLTLKKNHIMYVRRNGKCFWGSNCLCYTVPIVMSEDEYWSDNRENSPNKVTAPPKNFGEWVDKSENLGRIGKANEKGTLPYWLRDNAKIKDCSVLMSKARPYGDSIQEQAETIARKYNGTVTPINYKSFSSMYRKLNSEKDMLVSDIKDSVRNTIVVEKENIDSVVKELQSLPTFNRYKSQTPEKFCGYSGNIINLKMPNGIQAEIQVNTPKMIYAKETEANARKILGDKVWEQIAKETGMQGGLGHKYYEEIRILDEVKDRAKIVELTKLSKSYYAHFR